MAVSIALNAKVQRPGVCNAMETLLIHEKIAPAVLPKLKAEYDKAGVVLKGCDKPAVYCRVSKEPPKKIGQQNTSI
jgi:glutamate-5-semialdehyde dehydrogenase